MNNKLLFIPNDDKQNYRFNQPRQVAVKLILTNFRTALNAMPFRKSRTNIFID